VLISIEISSSHVRQFPHPSPAQLWGNPGKPKPGSTLRAFGIRSIGKPLNRSGSAPDIGRNTLEGEPIAPRVCRRCCAIGRRQRAVQACGRSKADDCGKRMTSSIASRRTSPTSEQKNGETSGWYIAIIRSPIPECWEDLPAHRNRLFAELRSDVDRLEGS
jgi:hypothetical protein